MYGLSTNVRKGATKAAKSRARQSQKQKTASYCTRTRPGPVKQTYKHKHTEYESDLYSQDAVIIGDYYDHIYGIGCEVQGPIYFHSLTLDRLSLYRL